MKFSESWLREYVSPDLSTQALVDQLTMAGLEVDGYEPVANVFSKVVVGEILEVNKHPDADKLAVCTVSSGQGSGGQGSSGEETHQVVCGAPNARQGIKVPFALIGAKLEDFKIKKAKLRGVESFGMLCSERELGISDKHEGLMELPQDAPVGTDVRSYLALDDSIVDLDLTPNRSDCLCMVGLGRETGLINALDVSVTKIEAVPSTLDDRVEVDLQADSACPRFVGRVIKNIRLDAETPLWMKEKLRRSDVRSIDPVVDVTNFVMLELGQPMHAYDLAKLQGKIVVRQSKSAEKVTLLDSSEVTLNENTLLITDDTGPIGIAGIMGGLSTSVTETTQDIYLESAFFAPTAITGRARSYGMNTDASHRFERGVDWEGQVNAIERATALLLEIAGGEAGPTTESVLEDALPKIEKVSLRLNRVKRVLGVEIEASQIDDILSRLGFEHQRLEVEGDTTWQVTAPSYRFDIAIEADLIEEVSRVYGYNNLPVRTPRTNLSMAPVEEGIINLNKIKDHLVTRGYQEAITYSFVDPKLQEILDPEQEPISLANPLSSEMAVMRTTLWPGLIKALIHNVNRQQTRVRLFESGLRFQQTPNTDNLEMSNVRQEQMLAGVILGPKMPEIWGNPSDPVDFFDLKGDVESIFKITGAESEFSFAAGQHPALHPGQTAQIMRGEKLVGFIGLLDPRAQKKLGIDQNVYLFELKLDEINSRHVPEAQSLSKFPEVRRDIAVIVDSQVSAAEINACVESVADSSFRNLMLFDVYQGKGIDPNRKSVALGLTFQHGSRTLTDDEINKFVDEIVEALTIKLGASLRN